MTFHENRDLREREIMGKLKSSEVLQKMKVAIENQDKAAVDELIRQMIAIVDQTQDEYVKRTFEIRKDNFQKMKRYCAEHDYSQKTFINVAIETLLNVTD